MWQESCCNLFACQKIEHFFWCWKLQQLLPIFLFTSAWSDDCKTVAKGSTLVNVENAVIHLGIKKIGFQHFNSFQILCLQTDIPDWSVLSVPLLLSFALPIAPSSSHLKALLFWLKAPLPSSALSAKQLCICPVLQRCWQYKHSKEKSCKIIPEVNGARNEDNV